MCTVTLLEIRLPVLSGVLRDVFVAAEWDKAMGYRVRDINGKLHTCSTADDAVKLALRRARIAFRSMQEA